MKETRAKKTVLSTPEAKMILEKLDVEKADQIQKRTLDFSIKFSKTTAERARIISSRIQEECGLTEEEAVEIVNILPHSVEELRVFTSGWKKLLPTDVVDKILNIISKHA